MLYSYTIMYINYKANIGISVMNKHYMHVCHKKASQLHNDIIKTHYLHIYQKADAGMQVTKWHYSYIIMSWRDIMAT